MVLAMPFSDSHNQGGLSPNRLASIVGEFANQAKLDNQAEVEHSLLDDLVRRFSTNPILARRAMRELVSRSPAKFYQAALQILREGEFGPGHDYLTGLMLENDILLAALADPLAFRLDAAVSLARHLYRLDPQIDARLLRLCLDQQDKAVEETDPEPLLRALHILDEVSDGTRLVPQLMKLLRHKDAHVRSKAGLLLVRAHRNADWLQQQVSANVDPRFRANLIEGLLYTKPTAKELEYLWSAAADTHHRVATTALLVLLKHGHAQAAEMLEQYASHPSKMFRAAAAWAMGQTGDPSFLPTLQNMVRTETGPVRSMALKASVLLRRTTFGGADPLGAADPAEKAFEGETGGGKSG